jgi:hypothetical protein
MIYDILGCLFVIAVRWPDEHKVWPVIAIFLAWRWCAWPAIQALRR